MKYLVLSFRGTVAEAVANKLQFPAEKILLRSNKSRLERFVADTLLTKYTKSKYTFLHIPKSFNAATSVIDHQLFVLTKKKF